MNTIPPYHELMWPILQAIQKLGGSATNAEMLREVVETEKFSEEVQAVLHKAGPNTELNYRLAWGRTYLKMVGALNNSSSGVWTVTEVGKAFKQQDMRGIPARVSRPS
jgi:restriction system protein